jgi:hypothetical protein
MHPCTIMLQRDVRDTSGPWQGPSADDATTSRARLQDAHPACQGQVQLLIVSCVGVSNGCVMLRRVRRHACVRVDSCVDSAIAKSVFGNLCAYACTNAYMLWASTHVSHLRIQYGGTAQGLHQRGDARARQKASECLHGRGPVRIFVCCARVLAHAAMLVSRPCMPAGFSSGGAGFGSPPNDCIFRTHATHSCQLQPPTPKP